MSDTSATALRRMIGMARRAPAHGSVRVEDALRLALSRAGQDATRVALAGGTIRSDVASVSGLAALLPQGGLWVVLQGSQRLRGVVGIDARLLAGLIEALTTGRISGAAAGSRVATQTDAVLLRRFLALLLDTLARRLDGQPASDWAAGYQPRDRVVDAARLPHLLPDMPYRVLSCDVDMAEGVGTGLLVLGLPEPTPVAQAENPRAAERAAFTAALARVLADAPTELEAVLYRMTLPLDAVAGLAPDMVLTIPRHALSEVTLQGCDGRVAAVARLGQSRGAWAVKLVTCGAGPGGGVDGAGGGGPVPRVAAGHPGAPTVPLPLPLPVPVPSPDGAP